MASPSDPDPDANRPQQPLDEETPLLVEQRSQHEPEVSGDTASDSEPKQPRSRSWWLWRVFWGVVGCLVLALFVKGWVDAGGDVDFDLKKALKRALGGGLSGAAAMVLQVLLLMPLRTIMNYQYRRGGTFTTTTKTLYQEGGMRRYYQGIGAALFQGTVYTYLLTQLSLSQIFMKINHLTSSPGPLSRFGDTAANAGILALLQSNTYLKDLPSPIKTIFAALCAASFRMILTPIDTLKTTLQVQGAPGTRLLRQRIRVNGIGSLWWGAIATAVATFVGYYPWFGTYNFLIASIPEPPKQQIFEWLLRLAFIGFTASVVSDTISNSLRVVKTYRQVNDTKVSYVEAARLVILQDGITGLLGRGLKTRILCNGLQGLLFSILWKIFLDLWEKKTSS
ncbi:hypothetical protein HYFRA_00008173 [Hymenoscyphus fraxineus]|uniref:Mitochondrial carrier n=1 Tax=Hymenoscyphus fraxineus TaxID=746836 RepID=A0A9N9PN64_9HELO|nr:hypothetical protein HYFRA_00008173 [Hymenoscyphus fraxineus]